MPPFLDWTEATVEIGVDEIKVIFVRMTMTIKVQQYTLIRQKLRLKVNSMIMTKTKILYL